VAQESILPDNRQSERGDLKMQNGKNAKRPAPTDQQDADSRKSRKKRDPAESELRRSLDMCSKFADAMGAIEIYDKVAAEGKLQFNQYNYNVLLYLCSSAASGSLKRGKSGTTEKQKGQYFPFQSTVILLCIIVQVHVKIQI
jgi:proteinaceous RNase P